MDEEQKIGAVEAMLFALGEPVAITTLADALECTQEEVKAILEKLSKKYEGKASGLQLRYINKTVTLETKEEYYPILIRAVKKKAAPKLSEGALEVLSIIAYRQPITRTEIEEIRSGSCIFHLNKLLEYNLIKELGRRNTTGRPIMYGTTDQFLKYFGFKDLSSLPKIPEDSLREMRKEAEDTYVGV